jgi:hypothetical protein
VQEFSIASGNILLAPYKNRSAVDFARPAKVPTSMQPNANISSGTSRSLPEARMETILALQARVEQMAVTMMSVQESIALTQSLISRLLEGFTLSSISSFFLLTLSNTM